MGRHERPWQNLQGSKRETFVEQSGYGSAVGKSLKFSMLLELSIETAFTYRDGRRDHVPCSLPAKPLSSCHHRYPFATAEVSQDGSRCTLSGLV